MKAPMFRVHPHLSLVLLIFILSGFVPKKEAADSFKVDTIQSKMRWTGYQLFGFGEHSGSIDLSDGVVRAEGDVITGGNFSIDMKSIRNLDMDEEGSKILTDHLKSDDFFSVDKFPSARFEITKAEKITDAQPGGPNYDVTGTLTLKGVTNTLKFPATIKTESDKLLVKAKFKFDRTRWNVRYSSGRFFDDVGDSAISDAIGIEIDLLASKN